MHGTELMDTFFSFLTTTPLEHAVPLSALSDPSQVNTVAQGIKFQHSIIAVQALSAMSRVHAVKETDKTKVEDVGVFGRFGKGHLNSTFPANVTNPSKAEARVFQDEKPTRVVQALLAASLCCSLLSWWFSPKLDVLPRSPTNPSFILAMLVGGNLYSERFGPEKRTIVEMTRTEVEETFGDKPAFWMGWGRTGSDFPQKGSQGTTGNSVSDAKGQQLQTHPLRFGIWAVPENA